MSIGLAERYLVPDVNLCDRERDLLEKLCDGRRHAIADLQEDFSGDPKLHAVARKYVTNTAHDLRKKMEPRGYTVLCEYYSRALHYRLVRLVGVSE